jgi:hypothetical protein
MQPLTIQATTTCREYSSLLSPLSLSLSLSLYLFRSLFLSAFEQAPLCDGGCGAHHIMLWQPFFEAARASEADAADAVAAVSMEKPERR